ncbi:hypothetical protein [Micromonospora sp. RTGN7]|uniref:hypothetical protein n=1 Tax=Micromonospora sp. RTGN7 TaxID=3016526 RepID=UPI0029FEFD7F|nr:hypothetical protein [Micromonospora sp. RTGN7]
MHPTYSTTEVHTLLYTAYLRGRYDADINDLRGTWAEMAEPRATREQRVQARLDDMDQVARLAALRADRPYRIYPGGPVDWETGRPVRHLGAVAA